MSKVLGFLARDLRHLRSGAIVAVVVAGIVAVPSFYAWFNIAGSWDPYGNTGNVRVAVANEDEGAGTALLPWRVNVGERVVGELRATDSIGYVVTSREDALEGVRSGAYYAAIVIPPEFSRDVLSALSADPVQARALFYQNEKANPIAAIVTDKASSAVRAQIERGFAEAVVGAGTGVLQELGRDLDDDALAVYEDDPAAAAAAVGEDDLGQLVIGRALHAVERDEGALYLGKTCVFYAHSATPYAFARRTEATALSTSSMNSAAGLPPPSSNFMRSSAVKTPVSTSCRRGMFCATRSFAPS